MDQGEEGETLVYFEHVLSYRECVPLALATADDALLIHGMNFSAKVLKVINMDKLMSADL